MCVCRMTCCLSTVVIVVELYSSERKSRCLSASATETTDVCHQSPLQSNTISLVVQCVGVIGSAVCGGIYSDRLVSVWSSSLSQNPSTETVKKWENKFTMRRWGDLVPRGQHL